MALLTVMGIFNYDNTIFDTMNIPTGMDRNLLINAIVLDTAELEVVYPEPHFLKTAISLWSHTRLETWNRIYNASQLEYDPIENYNRYEEETTGQTRQHSGSDSTTETDTESHTITNEITAFDSNTLQTHDSSSLSRNQSTNASLTHGEKIADSGTRTSHVHGNIGVTTSQQMLESEIEVAGKINVYDYIVKDFKTRFCILVY